MILMMIVMETMIVVMIKSPVIVMDRNNTTRQVGKTNRQRKQAKDDSHAAKSRSKVTRREWSKSYKPLRDNRFLGSVNPCSSSQRMALGPSVQIRKTSCTVPVPT
jgi:hypothetical protein